MLSGSVCTSQTAKSNSLSLSDIYLLIVPQHTTMLKNKNKLLPQEKQNVILAFRAPGLYH